MEVVEAEAEAEAGAGAGAVAGAAVVGEGEATKEEAVLEMVLNSLCRFNSTVGGKARRIPHPPPINAINKAAVQINSQG